MSSVLDVQRLVVNAFDRPRSLRSPAYLAGVDAVLAYRQHGTPAFCHYASGHPCWDAWHAGALEGYVVWARHAAGPCRKHRLDRASRWSDYVATVQFADVASGGAALALAIECLRQATTARESHSRMLGPLIERARMLLEGLVTQRRKEELQLSTECDSGSADAVASNVPAPSTSAPQFTPGTASSGPAPPQDQKGKEEVRSALIRLRNTALSYRILARFGAKSVSTLKAEDYPTVIEAADEAFQQPKRR